MLQLQEAPDSQQLHHVVSRELTEYVRCRETRNSNNFDLTSVLDARYTLHEAIPYSRVPRGALLEIARPLNDMLSPAGWHLQIHKNDQPRYYARAAYGAPSGAGKAHGAWVVGWFGEAWLAKSVDRAINWVDAQESSLNGCVQLLSSRHLQFSSFWLEGSGRHALINASRTVLQELPLRTWIEQDELRQGLLNAFSPGYLQAGIDG